MAPKPHETQISSPSVFEALVRRIELAAIYAPWAGAFSSGCIGTRARVIAATDRPNAADRPVTIPAYPTIPAQSLQFCPFPKLDPKNNH